MQPSEFCLIYVERGLIFPIKSYLILQIATFTTFSVSELLRENQEMGKNTLAPSQVSVKIGVIFSYNLQPRSSFFLQLGLFWQKIVQALMLRTA